MAKIPANPGKPAETTDEPKFRYSLELVATIAAHFVDGSSSDKAAADRAINFLDAVSKTIEGRMIMLRARQKAEKLSEESPKHLPFRKGLFYITGKKTETEAVRLYRSYLTANSRLVAIGMPHELTHEQVSTLQAPPVDAKQAANEAWISTRIAEDRQTGFGQHRLIDLKQAIASHVVLMRRFQAYEKGRKGGRPRKGQ